VKREEVFEELDRMSLLQVTGTSSTVYLGQFSIVFISLNAVLTGSYYNWVLLRRAVNSTVCAEGARNGDYNAKVRPSAATYMCSAVQEISMRGMRKVNE